MPIAITRRLSAAISKCELSFLDRREIDVELAMRQHAEYEAILASLGCRVESLPPAPELPDSVFVEDAAVVFDELAVITRPGALSRRAERAEVRRALEPYRSLSAIEAPGTLDGGDVLCISKRVYIGCSKRSNAAGIEQMGALLEPYGYDVRSVRLTGCLHLKSAVTCLGDHTILVNPALVNPGIFGGTRVIEVSPFEPDGANALVVAGTVIYPTAFPRTRRRLKAAGFKVASIDVSELAKAEGAVTCCSLIVPNPAC